METIVPIVIVLSILFQAGLYVRAVYLRRQLMLSRVLRFLERPDASTRMKEVAQKAFEDAISFGLPINMMNIFIRYRKDNQDLRQLNAELAVIENQEKDFVAAQKELSKIIELMFYINWKFNRLIFIYARFRTPKMSSLKSNEQAKEQYLDSRMGHQH